MKYIVANWKAHKTLEESQGWLKVFLQKMNASNEVLQNLEYDKLQIIIAPPLPFLQPILEKIHGYKNVCLAAQNISDKDDGSFTGEVTAHILAGLVRYALVGHSERRSIYAEGKEIIELKIQQAKKYNIEPILCIRNKQDHEDNNAQFVAYEPVEAIGTGNNYSIENVQEFKTSLELPSDNVFLYGGSVDSQNAPLYLREGDVQGLLVGSSSLDPDEFFKIIVSV